MIRADKKRAYRHAVDHKRVPPLFIGSQQFLRNVALCAANGSGAEFRAGIALAAILGISTCTGKELLT